MFSPLKRLGRFFLVDQRDSCRSVRIGSPFHFGSVRYFAVGCCYSFLLFAFSFFFWRTRAVYGESGSRCASFFFFFFFYRRHFLPRQKKKKEEEEKNKKRKAKGERNRKATAKRKKTNRMGRAMEMSRGDQDGARSLSFSSSTRLRSSSFSFFFFFSFSSTSRNEKKTRPLSSTRPCNCARSSQLEIYWRFTSLFFFGSLFLSFFYQLGFLISLPTEEPKKKEVDVPFSNLGFDRVPRRIKTGKGFFFLNVFVGRKSIRMRRQSHQSQLRVCALLLIFIGTTWKDRGPPSEANTHEVRRERKREEGKDDENREVEESGVVHCSPADRPPPPPPPPSQFSSSTDRARRLICISALDLHS